MFVTALTTVTFELPRVTSSKKLVICPHCLKNGKKEILGEVDEQGNFNVLRFHKGNTKIIAPEFAIECTCGEIVYRRTNPDGTVSYW